MQGLKLGSGSPSHSTAHSHLLAERQREQMPPPPSAPAPAAVPPIRVEDCSQPGEDSSVFSKISFYDEDDTRDVNVDTLSTSSSHTHLDSLSVCEPEPEAEAARHVSIPPSPPQAELTHDQPITKKRQVVVPVDEYRVTAPVSARGKERKIIGPGDNRPPAPQMSPEMHSSLSNLAEETYATFLSDIIGECTFKFCILNCCSFFINSL